MSPGQACRRLSSAPHDHALGKKSEGIGQDDDGRKSGAQDFYASRVSELGVGARAKLLVAMAMPMAMPGSHPILDAWIEQPSAADASSFFISSPFASSSPHWRGVLCHCTRKQAPGNQT